VCIVSSLIVDLGENKRIKIRIIGLIKKELLERIIGKFKSIMYSSLSMG